MSQLAKEEVTSVFKSLLQKKHNKVMTLCKEVLSILFAQLNS